MTTVTLDDSGKNYRVVCDGHATGNQDVCAAVSTLVFTAAIWLDEHPGLMCKVALADGHAELEFKDRKLWEFLSAGFEGLIDNFPKFIQKRGL